MRPVHNRETGMSLKKFRKGRPVLSMQQVLRDHGDEEAALDRECREMLADLEDWPEDTVDDDPCYRLQDFWDEPEDYGDPFYFGRNHDELDYEYF